jgi:hypothetical protein
LEGKKRAEGGRKCWETTSIGHEGAEVREEKRADSVRGSSNKLDGYGKERSD